MGFVVVALAIAAYVGRGPIVRVAYHAMGKRTVDDAMRLYAPGAKARLQPYFDSARVAYPPASIALLAFKDTKTLELWARQSESWILVRTYPIKAASGGPGPKLLEGDGQVPEGVYSLAGLNPNSGYHLSMKVGYPNEFDSAKAREDGRTNVGGDIFIHGKAASIGCLAMGDEAIEELFALVVDTGPDRVTVIVAPNDFRKSRPVQIPDQPQWLPALYQTIEDSLRPFPVTAP